MFDCSLEGSVEGLARLSGPDLAAAVSSNHSVQVQAENRTLLLAAAWADAHAVDPGWENGPLVERASVVGGEGTPEIGEFCCLEFGALTGVGMVSGRAVIADALDVRHRLPRLWERVCAGSVRAWKARRVAEATRNLLWAAAADVDESVAGLIEALPWSRFRRVLAAAIVDADPGLAAEQEAQARTRRGVWATVSEDGLKTVIAKAATGDAVVFLATVNRIADILRDEDADAGRPPQTVDVRRSRAVGILGQPGRALELLLNHRGDPDPAPRDAEPQHPAPQHPGRRNPEPAGLEGGDPAPGEPEPDGSGLWLPDLPAGLRGSDGNRRLGPRLVLTYHLCDLAVREGYGLVRPDDHGDPLSLRGLRDFLADTGCPVTVRPVLDPAGVPPVDRYEVPMRMRAALAVREIADVVPYGSLCRRVDLDHTQPYDPAGPPGQTSLGNLGPLSRTPHRAATVGGWRKRQPDPGTYLWRSPKGWIWLVTNQGTMNLGSTAFSRGLWRAAKPTCPNRSGNADGTPRSTATIRVTTRPPTVPAHPAPV